MVPPRSPVAAVQGLAVAVVLAVAMAAHPVAPAPIRVALFTGNGTGGASTSLAVLRATVAQGLLDAEVVAASSDTIENGLTRERFDAVYFPGGSGSHEAAAITAKGEASVRAFVAAGGGYLGICAGGYLATANFSWSLGLISAGVKEPWDRGMGNVTIVLAEAGRRELGLEAAAFRGNVSIFYGQGPILVPGHFSGLAPLEVLAHYTSEIHSKHTNETRGQMVGAPAISRGVLGKGRVLVSSPHPELTSPPIYIMLARYLQYVTNTLP